MSSARRGGSRCVAARPSSGRPSKDQVAGPRGCPPVAVRRVRGVGGRAGRRPGGRIRGDGDPSPRDPSPVGRPQGHPSPAGRPEGLPCHWPGRGTRCRSAGVVRRGREHASRAAGRARPRGSAGRSWRSARPAPHDCGGGGIRPRRAPPRGGCLFGRARDTWSAEWFVGCLWKRGGWRGGQQNTTISWWRTGQCYKSTECI